MIKQSKLMTYLMLSLLGVLVTKTFYEFCVEYRRALVIAADRIEADPLDIWATDLAIQRVPQGCEIDLYRHIKTTKPLTVEVARNMIFYQGNHQTEQSTLPSFTYTEGEPVEKDVTYHVRVPESYVDGLYLYQPVLNYKVNDNLTITKRAPSQLFEVDSQASCN